MRQDHRAAADMADRRPEAEDWARRQFWPKYTTEYVGKGLKRRALTPIIFWFCRATSANCWTVDHCSKLASRSKQKSSWSMFLIAYDVLSSRLPIR